MSRSHTNPGRDRKAFKLTANRQRRENLPKHVVPRGGTRH